MLDPEKVDFKLSGFHAGLEVHHQIRSYRKLFCACSPILEKNPESMDYTFFRFFRPVLGEMGDFDPGMLVEFEKGYKVIYLACERNTCTYEMDETPPFHPDMEAVKKGFILALYFNCSALANEVVVNRKQYLDGSITTGFQRTFICGRDGWVPVLGKKVRITNVHVEEDAARRVNWNDTSDRTVCFNLDRLGVPLTEVITDHRDVESPEELVELARQIGRVLRISRVGRRGIGSARQDVNLSISEGNRVEIKGVQNLRMFSKMCRYEVVRQAALIDIAREMKRRGLGKENFEHTYVDISHLFDLEGDRKAFATVFTKMKGVFGMEVQPNKDLGEEIFEKSMLVTGIPRESHFHSDELADDAVRKRSNHPCKLRIDKNVFVHVRNALNPASRDAIVVVVGSERRAMHALKLIVERVKMALDGVPQETRRLLPSGNSEFLRVIHGKERIYPDTDTPPIVITQDFIRGCQTQVGKRPWEILEELRAKHRLNQHQADLLIRTENLEKLHEYTELGLKASTAYRLLIDLRRQKEREGIHVTIQTVDKLAQGLSHKLMTLAQVDELVDILARQPELTGDEALKKVQVHRPSEAELNRFIREKLGTYGRFKLRSDKTYRDYAIPKIVGEILIVASHSIDGKMIAERVEALLKQEDI